MWGKFKNFMPIKKFLNNHVPFLILAFFFLILGACRKKQPDLPPPPQPVQQGVPVNPVVEEPKEKPVYVYTGDRFRDPFTPTGSTSNYQPEAIFDPQRTSVKAIIYSKEIKTAILNVTGSGSYFVKAGHIFDIMGKTVKGYSAKIMPDRVIILGEADTTFELKIKNSDEEAKTL